MQSRLCPVRAYAPPGTHAIMRPMNRNILSVFIAAGLLLLVLLVLWISRQPGALPPEALAGKLFPEPRPAGEFTLVDQYGADFDAERLNGHWSLMFFGYTHCPDICPTALTNMRFLYAKMNEEERASTQVVFVSVDPKRDTPEHLKQYMAYFNEAFIGLTGKREQIDALARKAGAIYFFDGDTSGDEYIVNHSAQILLVDPKGRFYAQFQPPHSPDEMLVDYRRLRDFYSE